MRVRSIDEHTHTHLLTVPHSGIHINRKTNYWVHTETQNQSVKQTHTTAMNHKKTSADRHVVTITIHI